ncbi:hypothetical protein CONCODRAFT_43994, partial [Conidiobolus coronatus NRRL 28638]
INSSSRTEINYCPNNLQLWVNNPTLTEFCFSMIRRVDIKGSKSYIAMNTWQLQDSYP